MAGIEDTSVVDVVGHDPTTDEYVLYMVETRAWGADPLQGAQLREKINAYAGFILDGSLTRHYPQTDGAKLRIQLDCPEAPVGEYTDITDRAATELDKLGVRLTINPRGF